MKSNKELLELLLSKIDHYMNDLSIYNSYGLCSVIRALYVADLITITERTTLNILISSFEHPIYQSHQGFWWKPQQSKPRIEWLKQIIKNLNNEN